MGFLLINNSPFAHFDHVDDVRVLQVFKRVDFCFYQVTERLVLVQDLDSVASAGVIFGKFYLARDP